MRECRGKRKDNGEWEYGWYCKNEELHYIIPDTSSTFNARINPEDLASEHFVLEGLVEVDPATVGQFAGLCDGDGKELDWWEGDVFDHPSGKCVIKWHQGGLYMHGSGGYTPVWDAANWAVLPTKVGTIHEKTVV